MEFDIGALSSRNAIAPSRRPLDDGGLNALRAKLLLQKSIEQPSYILPGEPPAKAFQPVIAQLGALLAGRQAAKQEDAKQQQMASLLTNLVNGRPEIVSTPDGFDGTGPRAVTKNVPYTDQEKLTLLAQNPATQDIVREQLFPKKGEGFSLSPGQIRYDPSGKPVASAPSSIPPESFTLSQGQVRFGPDGKQIASVAKDLTPEKDSGFKNAKDLRQEFIGQSRDFKLVSDSFGRIQSAAKNPSPAGDLALIFNYMKMLDPGSTVREGEFATAQNSASIPERIRAQYNRVTSGERLTDPTRSDFLDRAQSLYGAQEQGQKQIESVYSGLSQRAGISPENVIVDYRVKRDENAVSPRVDPSVDPIEAEMRRRGLLK